MRQRLLFAAALIHDPDVLLIDEPFVGLDPFGVKMIREMISGLSARGVTAFLATHSLHIAEDLCHRVGFILKGSLVSVKRSAEIKGERRRSRRDLPENGLLIVMFRTLVSPRLLALKNSLTVRTTAPSVL